MSNKMVVLFGIVFSLLFFASFSTFTYGIFIGNWYDIVCGLYAAGVSLVSFIMNLDGWK